MFFILYNSNLLCRIGIKFAEELQKNGFPNVSLLEGGFPSLVDALNHLRGSLEPVIIQHNPELWRNFLMVTGRTKDNSEEQSLLKEKARKNMTDSASYLTAENSMTIKKVKDMNFAEKTKMALSVAISLNHVHMSSILQKRIADLEEKQMDQDS